MIFGFDEHKGKVDVGAMLTQLQTNFQNNVNTLYNAFVAKGVKPAAKTVGALVTAVTTTYNKGSTDAQAISWTEVLQLQLGIGEDDPYMSAYSYGSSWTDIKNAESIKVQYSNLGSGMTAKYRFQKENGDYIADKTDIPAVNSYITIPSNAKYFNLELRNNNMSSGKVELSITRKAKVLR